MKMLFSTRSNRTYAYHPLTNRLSSTSQDEAAGCVSVPFGLSSEYDFSNIGMYTLEVTQQCNLRCRYCCYSGEYADRRQHNSTTLSYEQLARCVDFIAEHSGPEVPLIYVSFYGGEALLCQEQIKWVMAALERRCPHKEFEFSVSTNGVLLTPSVIDWVCETPRLYLAVTLDGNKAMHDRNRVTASGAGSFDMIIGHLRLFKEKYPELYRERVRFLSTVRSVSDLIPLNDFWMNSDLLRDNRPQHIASILPNFDKGESVSADREKFMKVYDVAFEHYCRGMEDILTDELDNLIKVVRRRDYHPLPTVRRLSTCLNVPSSCFITSDGRLYACERFCASHAIGNLASGISRRLCESINVQYARRRNLYCSSCWAQRICRKCPVGLNHTDAQFLEYCENEKMQLQLALKYYCEVLEHQHGIL